MERFKIWKSVSVSIFWIMVIFGVCWMLYEWATSLMSEPRTISFLGGVGLLIVDVMLFISVMDYQAYKIKNLFRLKKRVEVDREFSQKNQEQSNN